MICLWGVCVCVSLCVVMVIQEPLYHAGMWWSEDHFRSWASPSLLCEKGAVFFVAMLAVQGVSGAPWV